MIFFVYFLGSAKPEIDDDEKLLLYSMRFCPYAARAHLVLDAKKLSYKTVNINLVDKPEWLIEANPLGKVPCLQLRDKPNQPFIIESLLIAEYLDDIYPTPKLYPEDPLERVQEKIWIERFSPITSKFYQALTITDSDELLRIWSEMERLLDAFESELQRRGTKYFGGNEKANILDYAIWPWFQLMELVPKLFGAECDFSGERFPLLVSSQSKSNVFYFKTFLNDFIRFLCRKSGSIH